MLFNRNEFSCVIGKSNHIKLTLDPTFYFKSVERICSFINWNITENDAQIDLNVDGFTNETFNTINVYSDIISHTGKIFEYAELRLIDKQTDEDYVFKMNMTNNGFQSLSSIDLLLQRYQSYDAEIIGRGGTGYQSRVVNENNIYIQYESEIEPPSGTTGNAKYE